MQVTLTGPDDLGVWFLEDPHGRSWKVVERWTHHSGAAALFGWTAPEGMDNDDKCQELARLWLVDHTGECFRAPKHIADYFEELHQADQVTEP